ncbi:MAG TPA: 3-phosphoshikimate 1-carboxyvinyltransferase, partial [Phnomibacter sp.]|nr:3-phosphoshikimate 1-carboxyvinyltransferase [Phnomibacter sp.]
MTEHIFPGRVGGVIQANASKSAMQRACAAALLAKGTTYIKNAGTSNDDKAALEIIRNLGATIGSVDDNTIAIHSKGVHPVSRGIHCGESGLSIRMFTPIASLASSPIEITGEGSLTVRPMDFFDEVLPKLGVAIQSNAGKLPMTVHGPLQPADIEVDGSLSSQFLTGLLMAFSAANAKGVSLHVRDLKSKPYIDLTLQLMQTFGLPVPENRDHRSFYFHGTEVNSSVDLKREYTVEGDWSGAAFILVAGAIAGGEVRVNGIFNQSRQADKKIVDALLSAGAYLHVSDDHVFVRRSNLQGFNFDATDCPDLFPPLVALAALCKGPTTIHGLKRLKHKESDRGATLKEEFDKLNVEVKLEGDIMTIMGTGKVQVLNQKLNSHHDHRIAMAVAVAALCADIDVEIRNADA